MQESGGKRGRRRTGRRDFGSIKADGTPAAPVFSVRWLEGKVQRRKRGFATRGEAAAFLARKRVELLNGGGEVAAPVVCEVGVGEAIVAYGQHLTEKGNKPGPIADTLYRLRTFFPDVAIRLTDLTTVKCAGYYENLRTRVSRTGKVFSVDSHRNMLAEAKSLLKWCGAQKKWIPATRWTRSRAREAPPRQAATPDR